MRDYDAIDGLKGQTIVEPGRVIPMPSLPPPPNIQDEIDSVAQTIDAYQLADGRWAYEADGGLFAVTEAEMLRASEAQNRDAQTNSPSLQDDITAYFRESECECLRIGPA